jgi:hypothetical protein
LPRLIATEGNRSFGLFEIQGNITVSDDLFFAALYTTSEKGEFSDVLEWWTMSAESAFIR